MERASKHCMKARIFICHDHIKSIKNQMNNTRHELAIILPTATLQSLNEFLKQRMLSVCDTIKDRHQKKFDNLSSDYDQINVNRSKWVINLSSKPFTDAERSLLEKGSKFAIIPAKIPYKNIISEIEAAITYLPDETTDIICTHTASIID